MRLSRATLPAFRRRGNNRPDYRSRKNRNVKKHSERTPSQLERSTLLEAGHLRRTLVAKARGTKGSFRPHRALKVWMSSRKEVGVE